MRSKWFLIILLVLFLGMEVDAKRRKRKRSRRWRRRNSTPVALHNFGNDNPTPGVIGSTRGKPYFAVDTSTGLAQLWVTNGTEASTEAIYTFAAGQALSNYMNNRGKIYFVVTTSTTNADGSTTKADAIWVTDGDEDGTEAIHTLDNSQSVTSNFGNTRGNLYFVVATSTTAADGSSSVSESLWMINGKDNSTESIYDLKTDEVVSSDITNTRGKNFFVITTTTTNADGSTSTSDALWSNDGTDEGTELLQTFETNEAVSSNMTSTRGKLFFTVTTTTTNADGSTSTANALWASDCLENGAESIYSFAAGESLTGDMSTTKGKLFFVITTTVTNADGSTSTTDSLWTSAGGEDDTESIYDFESGKQVSSSIVTTKGVLYFIVTTTVTNADGSTSATGSLWQSDGKDTEVIKEDYSTGSVLYNPSTAKGNIYFINAAPVSNLDGSTTFDYSLMIY